MAYVIRHKNLQVYNNELYRNMGLFLMLLDCVVICFFFYTSTMLLITDKYFVKFLKRIMGIIGIVDK